MVQHLELNNKNIDNKKFLEFFINRNHSNMNGIRKINFNKKSISVTIDKDLRNFFFNDFFTEKSLRYDILTYLKIYVNENNLNLSNDLDIYKWKFEKINVNYK